MLSINVNYLVTAILIALHRQYSQFGKGLVNTLIKVLPMLCTLMGNISVLCTVFQ
jgi:hypothetical protein